MRDRHQRRRRRRSVAALRTHYQVVGLALLGVIGASIPAAAGRLAPTDPVLGTPAYWAEPRLAGGQLGGSVALLAPGSSFGEYLWGSPHDEPMQWLADSRWAVRNAIPLTPPGNIRMLDAFEARMAQGQGSPGLASDPRRAGVQYVVVRNDLPARNDVPDPVLVHQALTASPGIRSPATFGPDVGSGPGLHTDGGRVLVNDGWQGECPAIEIFEMDCGQGRELSSAEPCRPSSGDLRTCSGWRTTGPARAGPALLGVTPTRRRRPTGRYCSPTACSTANASSGECTTVHPR